MALSKIKSDSIDSIAATKLTGTVDNARITLDAAEIPNLDAAKITTGSIANARVPAAAVTQHVAAADLTPAHQGIANLGLIMATEHDKVAFNLTGSFIDIFQDDSGITTETDVDRNASEYVSPNVSGIAAYVTTNRGSTTPTVTVTSYGITTANGSVGLLVNGVASGSASNAWNWNNQTPSAGAYVQFAYSTAMIVTEAKWHQDTTHTHGTWKWQGSNTAGGASGYVDIGSTFTLGGPASPFQQVHTTLNANTTLYLYYRMAWQSGAIVFNSWLEEIEFKEASSLPSTSATGTLISDAQTVASTTEVSGVFTYTDYAGTNTIGTDLKIYFTANNGTNWTEAASYGTATTFSGSIKQVKLGKTTVTAGTQVALKAVWANQASTVAAVAGGFTDYATQTGGYTPAGGSGNVWALFDNSTATYPVTGGGATQGFYTDFGSGAGQACNRYTLTSWNGNALASPSSWTIYASNDASSWTTITSQSGASAWSSIENRIFDFSNTTVYRYWGIDLVTTTGHAPELCEVEFGVLSAGTAEVIGKVAHLNGWAVNY